MNEILSIKKPQSADKLARKAITRTRVSKYQKVIEAALKLKAGEMFVVPTPEGSGVEAFRNSISTVCRDNVTSQGGPKFRYWVTEDDDIAVVRPKRKAAPKTPAAKKRAAAKRSKKK